MFLKMWCDLSISFLLKAAGLKTRHVQDAFLTFLEALKAEFKMNVRKTVYELH